MVDHPTGRHRRSGPAAVTDTAHVEGSSLSRTQLCSPNHSSRTVCRVVTETCSCLRRPHNSSTLANLFIIYLFIHLCNTVYNKRQQQVTQAGQRGHKVTLTTAPDIG